MNTGLRRKTVLTTVVVVLANVFGNFFLSLGLKNKFAFASPLDYLRAFLSPWVIVGVALLILWMLSRLALLSWADLSFVLPVTAFGYVLNALIGRLLLAEQVSGLRWGGTLCIIAGVLLVGGTEPRTGERR